MAYDDAAISLDKSLDTVIKINSIDDGNHPDIAEMKKVCLESISDQMGTISLESVMSSIIDTVKKILKLIINTISQAIDIWANYKNKGKVFLHKTDMIINDLHLLSDKQLSIKNASLAKRLAVLLNVPRYPDKTYKELSSKAIYSMKSFNPTEYKKAISQIESADEQKTDNIMKTVHELLVSPCKSVLKAQNNQGITGVQDTKEVTVYMDGPYFGNTYIVATCPTDYEDLKEFSVKSTIDFRNKVTAESVRTLTREEIRSIASSIRSYAVELIDFGDNIVSKLNDLKRECERLEKIDIANRKSVTVASIYPSGIRGLHAVYMRTCNSATEALLFWAIQSIEVSKKSSVQK